GGSRSSGRTRGSRAFRAARAGTRRPGGSAASPPRPRGARTGWRRRPTGRRSSARAGPARAAPPTGVRSARAAARRRRSTSRRRGRRRGRAANNAARRAPSKAQNLQVTVCYLGEARQRDRGPPLVVLGDEPVEQTRQLLAIVEREAGLARDLGVRAAVHVER